MSGFDIRVLTHFIASRCCFRSSSRRHSARIAAFDLDGTLENPKPGKDLYKCTSPADFVPFSPEVGSVQA